MTLPRSSTRTTAPAAATTPEPRGIAAPFAGAVLALLAFLPVPSWVMGQPVPSWYVELLGEWANGLLIAVGLGIVLAMLSRRRPALWRDGMVDRLTARVNAAPVRWALALATATFVLYVVVAWTVFDARPLLIDEIVQLWQAQMFAAGRLSRPTLATQEFFSVLHIVDTGDKVYSHFPPGGPAMLAIGVLLGAPWIIGPLCSALAVYGYARWLRFVEPRDGVASGAAVLFAFAPFAVFMGSSHMNHVPALMFLVGSMVALGHVMTSATARPGWAFAHGLALGVAATIRPLDALAFALPAAGWYLIRAAREPRRWADAFASGFGVALPALAMMWFNLQTTGAPLLFGYAVLWGSTVELGFHASPWGPPHTPARGLGLIGGYFMRLQTYLFEAPIPALLPVAGALLLARRLRPFDRYLLAAATLTTGFYWAYWHDGFFLGPRFFHPLLPFLVLWAARFPAALRGRIGSGLVYRGAVYTLVVAAVVALAFDLPLRARGYSRGLISLRADAEGAAARAGARNAVVLVRESWGAQLVTRLWAAGVTRPQSELIYRSADACTLDATLARVEREGVRGEAAFAMLHPIIRDSARLVEGKLSSDPTLKLLPGTNYSPRCRRRLAEDRGGFSSLAPHLLIRDGNVYARDLHLRDTLLLREYAGRPLYLLRQAGDSIGSPLVVVPVNRDSLARDWAVERGELQ